MSAGGPLPFLDVSGVEIANAARTLAYLRRGLADTNQGHWELGDGDLCSVLDRPYGVPETFVSPAADPAPWYSAAEPGSADFLGLVLLDLDGYDSTVYRDSVDRLNSLGGAVLSGQYRHGRAWKFRAAMVSSSDVGAEYGLRWLTQKLQAPACDGCSLGSLTVRLVCPPDDGSDDDLGVWTSYDVALVDGPREVEKFSPRPSDLQDVLAGCRDYVIEEWTMLAANPFLYKPSACLASGSITGGAHGPFCLTVAPPEIGAVCSVFELSSVAGFGGPVYLEAYTDCAVPDTAHPDLQIVLSGVPPDSTVTVDSGQHKITVDTGGVVTDGSYLVELAPNRGIEWLEIAACDTEACFCIRTGAGASGTVAYSNCTQKREG